MSFVLCTGGTGTTNVPCKGCKKNPCEALELLKKATSELNSKACSMALDFGVIYCIARDPPKEFAIGPVVDK